MSVIEYRERIAALHIKIQDKHSEVRQSIHNLESYFSFVAQQVRAGHPTSGLVEESFERIGALERESRQFFDSCELAISAIEGATSEFESMVENFEPSSKSIKTLQQRIQRAKTAGDTQAISNLRSEFDQLKVEFGSHERNVYQYEELIRTSSTSWKDRVLDVQTALRAGQIHQCIDEIERLTSPPALAIFFLAAASKPSLRDGVLGDAEESFGKSLDEHGRPWAVALFWIDTCRSLCPLITRLAVRAIRAYVFFSR